MGKTITPYYFHRFIVIGGKDMTVRVYPVFSMEKFKVFSLTGHRSTIINCFFEKDSLNVSFQNVSKCFPRKLCFLEDWLLLAIVCGVVFSSLNDFLY